MRATITRSLVILTLAVGVVPASAQDDSATIDHSYYPQLGFALLDQSERRLFVDLAEAELCPCPGPPQSLSSCLRDAEQRCALSEEVASLMMRQIKEDLGSDQIRDAVTRFITEARTPRHFDLSHAPRRGSPDADIEIIVFSDFECPHCRRFAATMEQLFEEYGDRVALYYLHFPLPQHENSLPASRAAIAAGRQGHFWEMHDLLFANQTRLQEAEDPRALFFELAGELELDLQQFARDYEDAEASARAVEDREVGRAAGVNSTPTCFVNGIKYLDDESYPALQAHLSSLL